MCAQSRRELLLALRPQYLIAPPGEKTKLLDGLIKATGYDRKYAVTLLRKGISTKQEGKRKRQRKYDQAVVNALLIVWKAAYRVCSKRLIPFMPVLIESLIRHGHLDISDTVKAQLLSISPATADRLLIPERRKYGKGISTTKPGYLIKKHIPIRTFADWNDVVPGFLEADLVAHCGENIRGQYLHTLTVTDIASGWTELGALMGKGEGDVLAEIAELKALLPFPLLGLDTDNGGEFINYGLVEWCSNNNITFTRSREYKKNDQAHVEEKNGSIVRKLIGYDRYEGIESWQRLSQLYGIARLYINFFQPCLKLIEKWRDGARVHKRYDKAKTPYQRILAAPSVPDHYKESLRELFLKLDPVLLLEEMEQLQVDLWRTAVGLAPSEPKENAVKQDSPVIDVQHGTGSTSPEVNKPEIIEKRLAPTPTRKKTKTGRNTSSPKEDKSSRSGATPQDQDAHSPVPAQPRSNAAKSKKSGSNGLAHRVHCFLNDYLGKRKASSNTISSYRDSLRLLLQFAQRRLGKESCQLELSELNTSLVSAFLDDMETRGMSAGTRNLRLAAIRSFCRYAVPEAADQSAGTDCVLAIPSKHYARPEFDFLNTLEVEAILSAPDQTTWTGRRDQALLLIAVETGLLVSEITNLRRQDVEPTSGASIRISGKGRKQRDLPLSEAATGVLQAWLQEPARSKSHRLFPNARGRRLTDDGVSYILRNHLGTASEICISLQDKRVTPYLLRHTSAMRLVQAGLDREKLALWLGLESAASAQPYLTANHALQMKLNKHQAKTKRAPGRNNTRDTPPT